jgi:hypothetical protein
VLGARLDDASVDGDGVSFRIDEDAGRRWKLIVHANRAGGDELVSTPPAGHAGPRQKSIQPFQ